MVGLTAGLIGTSVSSGLIAVRKRLDPDFVPQNELPNLPLNAACKASNPSLSDYQFESDPNILDLSLKYGIQQRNGVH